jgi:hypothetical protein
VVTSIVSHQEHNTNDHESNGQEDPEILGGHSMTSGTLDLTEEFFSGNIAWYQEDGSASATLPGPMAPAVSDVCAVARRTQPYAPLSVETLMMGGHLWSVPLLESVSQPYQDWSR